MSDTTKTIAPQQVEAARFRSAVSESLLQGMQGNINYLLGAVLPVGSFIHSILSEAQFQSQVGTGWILADGRSISGSALATLSGFTTAPDARGIFMRGRNNGRSTTTGNSTGAVALGSYEADTLKTHFHNLNGVSGVTHLTETGGDIATDDGSELARPDVFVTDSVGDTETKPRNITTNIFLRIN